MSEHVVPVRVYATMDQRIEAAVEFAPGEFAQQVKTLVDAAKK